MIKNVQLDLITIYSDLDHFAVIDSLGSSLPLITTLIQNVEGGWSQLQFCIESLRSYWPHTWNIVFVKLSKYSNVA